MGASTLVADVALGRGVGAGVGAGAGGARWLLQKLAFSAMSHLEY